MQRTIQSGVVLTLVAVAALFVGRLLVGAAGGSPVVQGLNAEAPRGGCPSTPNCVSSVATDPAVAVDPFACTAAPAEADAIVDDAVAGLGRVDHPAPGEWVVYSDLFEFPDDLRIASSERGIEVLSASRLGTGDLGANRDRVEALRPRVESDPRCG